MATYLYHLRVTEQPGQPASVYGILCRSERAACRQAAARCVDGYIGGAQLVAVTDGRASLVEVYGAD